MPAGPSYVIVGASLAGAKAAETLREDGLRRARSCCSGDEPELPYERPPLSKGYLLGRDERSSIYVHDAGWYAGHDVDLRLGVTAARHRPRRPPGGAGRRQHRAATTSC